MSHLGFLLFQQIEESVFVQKLTRNCLNLAHKCAVRARATKADASSLRGFFSRKIGQLLVPFRPEKSRGPTDFTVRQYAGGNLRVQIPVWWTSLGSRRNGDWNWSLSG